MQTFNNPTTAFSRDRVTPYISVCVPRFYGYFDKTAYDARNTKQKLLINDVKGARFQMVEIDQTSPLWEKSFKQYCHHLTLSIEACTRELDAYNKRLANWKPAE